MIITNSLVMPIPKGKNYVPKVEINDTEYTHLIYESEWIKPVTFSIGTFSAKLVNTGGLYTGTFAKDQNVKFYCDRASGTVRRFWGRIDYVKDIIGREGQFLEITGRHRSYQTTEKKVNYSGEKDPAEILKDIISENLAGLGFTTTNINTVGITIKVSWNYKPFWECVIELCNNSGFDCYVDDDLDWKFFEANSVINDDEAIVDGDTLIENSDWGTDDFYEKSRVTVMGQDDTGLVPVLFTSKTDSDTEANKREVFIKDTSLRNEFQVRTLADGELTSLSDRPPQANMKCFFLEPLNPGDNIPIIIPRQKIYGYYKVIQIKDRFGMNSKFPRTDVMIEKETGSFTTVMKDRIKQESRLQNADNPNKLLYSYNFEFNDNTNIDEFDGTVVEDGGLKLSGTNTTGNMTSSGKTVDDTITRVELRTVGTDLGYSSFEASCNGGTSWFTVTNKTVVEVATADQGVSLKLRPTLKIDNQNINPFLDSAALIFT